MVKGQGYYYSYMWRKKKEQKYDNTEQKVKNEGLESDRQ